jgi:hypothetical protein
MKKLFYSLLISVFFLSFLFLKDTHAQSLSIGTAPTHEKLQLEPGQIYHDNFTVWNLSTTTTTYFIEVSSFRQLENQPGSAIFLSEEEDAKNPYSAADWVEVEMDSIDLVPNRNFTIDYTITVPEELAPGDYNAEIYFTSQETIGGDETAAYSILGSGVPILITIGDEYAESAEILDFYSKDKMYERPTSQPLLHVSRI